MLLDPYQFQTTTIRQILHESPEAVSVQLEPLAGYSFQSGQHTVVRAKVNESSIMRQYSFSSAPSSGEIWLTIVKTPDGAMSSWFVEAAKAGDAVELSRPFDGPLSQEIPDGRICMIAGGSGIAPLMSLLREKRRLANATEITLLYSTREERRCFVDELTPLSHETIIIHSSTLSGRITEKMVRDATTDCTAIYVCGPRSFVLDVQKMCQKYSPSAQIACEAFTL